MRRALGLGILVCASFAALIASANAATLRTVTCSDNASSDPATLDPVIAAAGSGDVIAITGLCAGDYLVGTSGLTFSNQNATLGSTEPAYVSGDGFDGMVEVNGGSHELFSGIEMTGATNSASTASSASGSLYNQIAALLVHDAGSATIINSTIENAGTSGLWVEHGAAATVLATTISGNGTAAANIYADGIVIQSGSTVQLGALNGTLDSTVTGNGVSSTSCEGYGIQLGQGSSLIAYEDTIGTSGAPNGCGEIYMIGATAKLWGTTLGQPGTFGPAIAAYQGSSVSIDTDYVDQNIGGVHQPTTIDAGGHASVLLVGASSAIIGGATLQTTTPTQATLTVSNNSNATLAGGNTITNTSPTGLAIQVDHSSSVSQQLGYLFADPVSADTINGAGVVQVQSSMDLGGLGEGSPSISWTTGNNNIQVEQNSSFRVSGGVSITGAVTITQGSNGFANTSGGSNAISGGASCPFSNVPSSHWASPAKVSPAVPSATSYSGATSPECLSF